MNPPDIHPAYFNVHFRGPWPDRDHPEEFAIMNAYATAKESKPLISIGFVRSLHFT